jgi:hypothetical protein
MARTDRGAERVVRTARLRQRLTMPAAGLAHNWTLWDHSAVSRISNQEVVMSAVSRDQEVRSKLRVQSHIRAGGMNVQHNRKLAALKVRTNVRAGGLTAQQIAR